MLFSNFVVLALWARQDKWNLVPLHLRKPTKLSSQYFQKNWETHTNNSNIDRIQLQRKKYVSRILRWTVPLSKDLETNSVPFIKKSNFLHSKSELDLIESRVHFVHLYYFPPLHTHYTDINIRNACKEKWFCKKRCGDAIQYVFCTIWVLTK